MTQFLWSRAAPFLVLALACLSGMCCAATTAGPKTTAARTTVKETTEAPTTAPLTTINETTTAPATTSNGTTAAPTTMSTSSMTTAAINMTTTPSNMTTAPSNMTTAPSNMTTAPSNMTTAPSNMTTAPSTLTTAPSNMTTAPSNMTTMPSNMTTVSSNMTTAPSNMTTAPSNMTTAPSNITTAPSNMTTVPSNMTTVSSNMTTAPSDMTTSPSNMTTMPSTMSTTQIVTTPAPEIKWRVKDKNGKLCMLMGFDGTIIYKNRTHQIPLSASIAKSSCDSADLSKFVVEFSDGEFNLWQLVLNFTMKKGSFKLSKMMLSLYVNSKFNTDGTAQENFEVPVGDYYKCDSLNMTATPFLVNLTEPVFQPFVEKTKGGHSLGNECHCGTKSFGNIDIIIEITLPVGSVTFGLSFYCYLKTRRRHRRRHSSYSSLQ